MLESNAGRLERAQLVKDEDLTEEMAELIAGMDPEEVSTLIHRVNQHQPLRLETPTRMEPGFVF